MSGLTPEASRLYRVRKTTVKMLHNRCVPLSIPYSNVTPDAADSFFTHSDVRGAVLLPCIPMRAVGTL